MPAVVNRIYTKVLEIMIGLLLAEMILVGFAAVVARFLLSEYVSLYWAEEVIRYSFIWSVFLVSPLVIRRGANLELDLFLQWLSPQCRRGVALFNSLVILVFLMVLIVQGIRMVRVNVEQLSSALEISMAWIYLAVPTGGCLMLGEYVAILIRIIRGTSGWAPGAGPVAVQ
ncbi:MAG TPA: TRAP transporter small permease [Candidatus Methylomirabilis sp.]|nr:TRAP transporter small permease [Candidatus Methylomirabilis sp.]